MKPLIILTGPTAVGKTELSIRLAKAVNGRNYKCRLHAGLQKNGIDSKNQTGGDARCKTLSY